MFSEDRIFTSVQMQYLRPSELEVRAVSCPVVYVPFGLIEWHGLHLPLGNDALKAHAVCCHAAVQHGGVVYPPIYFHSDFDRSHLVPLLRELFGKLRDTGFRVILGVSGHNVESQMQMVDEALAPIVADGTVAGMGLWEMSLSRSEESDSDHAAKWETSNMMFLYPELVDMTALGSGELNLDMKPPSGIGGLDPRSHASAAVGKRNIALCADALGRKARELLAALPKSEQHFRMGAITCDRWFGI